MPPKKNKKAAEKPDSEEKPKKQKKPTKNEESKIDDSQPSQQKFSQQQDQLGDGKFPNGTINISSWNINGIRAANSKGHLSTYLKNFSPEILCLNETKIDAEMFKKEKISEMFPQEYHQFFNFCKPPQKGYAGTAILTKVKPISVIYDLGIKEHDQEGRTITLEFDKFFIVACYVPNAGQGLKRLDYRVKKWDPDFQKFLNNLKTKKPTILCGDLNVCHHEIDISNPKGNEKSAGFTKQERAQFTDYLNMGWIDSFRQMYPDTVKYSYWNMRSDARKQNKGWRLDYFVIDKDAYDNGAVQDSIINNDIEGSDHCPIELKWDLKKI